MVNLVEQYQSDHVLLACAFAFTTGWIDVLCVIQFGAFATIMTGNFILTAEEVASGHWDDALHKGSTILSYCGGVLIFVALDKALKGASGRAQSIPVMVCLSAVDLLPQFVVRSEYYVCLVSTAMGSVNAGSVQVSGIETNLVTGKLEKLVQAGYKHFFVERLDKAAALHTKTIAKVLLALTLGAVGSAIVYGQFKLARFDFNFTLVGGVYTILLWARDKVHADDLRKRQMVWQERSLQRQKQSLSTVKFAARLATKLHHKPESNRQQSQSMQLT